MAIAIANDVRLQKSVGKRFAHDASNEQLAGVEHGPILLSAFALDRPTQRDGQEAGRPGFLP
jgi:hypothetical protein